MPFCFQPLPEPGNGKAYAREKQWKIRSYPNLEVLTRLRCDKALLAEPLCFCFLNMYFCAPPRPSPPVILFIWYPSLLLEINTNLFNSISFKYHSLLQKHIRKCPQRPLMYTKTSSGLQFCIRDSSLLLLVHSRPLFHCFIYD